jgi:hypothetical protein
MARRDKDLAQALLKLATQRRISGVCTEQGGENAQLPGHFDVDPFAPVLPAQRAPGELTKTRSQTFGFTSDWPATGAGRLPYGETSRPADQTRAWR